MSKPPSVMDKIRILAADLDEKDLQEFLRLAIACVGSSEMSRTYVDHAGTYCPFCGSDQLVADFDDADGVDAWFEVRCLTCRTNWFDDYRLIGFSNPTDEAGNDLDLTEIERCPACGHVIALCVCQRIE